MAIATIQTFLMHNTETTTWVKLVDIKDYPDLGGNASKIDTTTLSNTSKTSIQGLKDTSELSFKINYDKETFTRLRALETSNKDIKLALWFGATSLNVPDGHDGKFTFTGKPSIHLNGGGIDAVVEATLKISLSSEIELAND